MSFKENIRVAVRDYLNLLLDEKADDRMNHEALNKVSNIFMEDKEICKKYSKRDIEDYFINICIFLKKNVSDITDEEMVNYVDNILNKKSQTIMCFVPLYELEDFPEGIEVANSKITLFENLPVELKKRIEEHYTCNYSLRDESEKTLNTDGYKKIYISKHWICRKLDFVGYYKLYDDAYEKINDDLNILRIYGHLVYGIHQNIITLNHHDLFLFEPNTKSFLSSHEGQNSIRYLKPFDEEIKILNGLFLKDSKNDIDSRIVTALKIFALQTTVTPIEIKFVLIINALEGLLLSNNDINYLGKHLCEKVAFLVGKDKSGRLENDYKMKKMYNKRSNFTHQKKNIKEKDKIIEPDLLYLSNVFFGTIRKLLELEKNNTIQAIEGEEKSLDLHIKELIFS